MNRAAQTALRHHCRLSIETMHPRFGMLDRSGFSVVLTVNSGYECIEAGFGGPVWHVSVAPLRAFYGATLCEKRALQALDGLGAPELGEWREWTGRAFHIRRRLTADEQLPVGPVVDIRRTPEARDRAAALPRKLLAHIPPDVFADETGD